MSRTKAAELIAAHLMEHEGAWLCDRCLARTLAPLELASDDEADAVRAVGEELRGEPGFERQPALCARCETSALVALRYVRNR